MKLSQKLDQSLIDLAWSLWTELGVRGIKRHHQNCFISLEELILLTVIIAQQDPRLRDESLDWCSRYHHFISISRLRSLLKAFDSHLDKPFSEFAAKLNSCSNANWPLFSEVGPVKFMPSGKSKPPRCELPALVALRLRALFGTGARADLITFFLTQNTNGFTASDTTEIGYTKSSLAVLLDNFVQSGLYTVSTIRNQKRYCFTKRDKMKKILGAMPKIVPSWKQILEVIMPLRKSILEIENKSAEVKIVEIRTTLKNIEAKLKKLNLAPPPLQSDFVLYWESFSTWIIDVFQLFAQGHFDH